MKNEYLKGFKNRVWETCRIIQSVQLWIGVLILLCVLYFGVLLAFFINDFFPEFLLIAPSVTNSFLFTCPVFILILVFLVLFVFLNFKYKYRLSQWMYFASVFIVFSYFVFRFEEFQPRQVVLIDFKFGLKILDIPFFLIGLTAIISFFRDFAKPTFDKSNNTYLEDTPFIHEIDDEKVELIYNKIQPALFDDNYEKAFSIGLIGPWGSGKSSILKGLEKKIDKIKFNGKNQRIIHLSFSPFLNHNEVGLINHFFLLLQNKLSPYNGKLSNKLTNYSDKLTNLIKDKNPLALLKPGVLDFNNESVSQMYGEIESAIRKLGFKIIVSIDDLDRLNCNEIIQVLKLIRTTSDFPNIVFLLAIDKEYVKKELSKEFKDSQSPYLDKFFQLEIPLTFIEPENLLANFNRIFKVENIKLSRFSTEEKNTVKSFLENLLASIENNIVFLHEFFPNYREVKFFYNNFISDLKFLVDNHGNILAQDYLILQIVKRKFPEIYYLFGTNYEKLLSETKDDDSGEVITIDLLHEDDAQKFGLELKNNYSEILKIESINLDEKSEKKFFALCTILFDKTNREPTSVRYSPNFILQITQLKNNNLFTFSELLSLLNEDYSYDKLKEILSGTKRSSFLKKIKNYEPLDAESYWSFGYFLILLQNDYDYTFNDTIESYFFNLDYKPHNDFPILESERKKFYKDYFAKTTVKVNFQITYLENIIDKGILQSNNLEDYLGYAQQILVNSNFKSSPEQFDRSYEVFIALCDKLPKIKFDLLNWYLRECGPLLEVFYRNTIDVQSKVFNIYKSNEEFYKVFVKEKEDFQTTKTVLMSVPFLDEVTNKILNLYELTRKTENKCYLHRDLKEIMPAYDREYPDIQVIAKINKHLANSPIKISGTQLRDYIYTQMDNDHFIYIVIANEEELTILRSFMQSLLKLVEEKDGILPSLTFNYEKRIFTIGSKKDRIFEVVDVLE